MYRIRAYLPLDKEEVMNRPFQDSVQWEAYWKALTEDKTGQNLQMFAGLGNVVLAKESMTELGNWEVSDKLTVKIMDAIA